MKTSFSKSLFTALRVAALFSVLFGPSLFSATLHDLGTLGGNLSYSGLVGGGINNLGQVAGFASTIPNAAIVGFVNDSHGILKTDLNPHAFLSSGGVTSDLGTLGGTYSVGSGVNDSGQVVGYAGTSGTLVTHAFLDSGGVMTDLGALLGEGVNKAWDINNSGQIVGESNDHAFLRTGGTTVDLGTLGGDFSDAIAINNSGHVVGASTIPNGYEHAFISNGGVMTDLGTLDKGSGESTAFDINSSDQVVGYSNAAGGYHAFLTNGGVMTDLGTLGGEESFGFGVNDSGEVVGSAETAANQDDAFIYTGGTMYDLNTLYAGLLGDGTTPGFVALVQAGGINNFGQISGVGEYFDGTGFYQHAFLLDMLDNPIVPNDGGSGGAATPDATGTLGLLAISFVGLIALKGKYQTRSA